MEPSTHTGPGTSDGRSQIGDTDRTQEDPTEGLLIPAEELLISLDELLGTLIDLVASGKIRLGVGLTQRLTGARERISVELATNFDETLIDDEDSDDTDA